MSCLVSPPVMDPVFLPVVLVVVSTLVSLVSLSAPQVPPGVMTLSCLSDSVSVVSSDTMGVSVVSTSDSPESQHHELAGPVPGPPRSWA